MFEIICCLLKTPDVKKHRLEEGGVFINSFLRQFTR